MDDHRYVTKIAEAPRNPIGKPENEATEEQENAAPEKSPEQNFLTGVKSPDRRHKLIFIADVMRDGVPPFFIDRCLVHLSVPHAKHQQHRNNENQTNPGMQLARYGAPTQGEGQPEEPGRPKCQARQHKINVGKTRQPVHQTLWEGITQNISWWNPCVFAHCPAPDFFCSSSSSILGPNRR